MGSQQYLILDATGSGDLDNTPGEVTYTWSCTNLLHPNNPCYGVEGETFAQGDILMVPSTSLTIGEYQFTLIVSKTGRANVSDSVIVSTNGKGPSVLTQV